MNGIKNALTGIIAMLAAILASITERSPGRRLSPGVKTLALAGIVLLVAAGSASAVNYESTGSGWWDNPDIWSPAGVPGPWDDAIIHQGHEVGLCWSPPGSGRVEYTSVDVDTLQVDGTLAGVFPVNNAMAARGFPIVVYARVLTNNGNITGSPAYRSDGGSIYLSSPEEYTGQFINNGTILATNMHGDASELVVGGSVYIAWYDDITNLGDITAGDRVGCISIVGEDIVHGDPQNIASIQAGAGGLIPGVCQYATAGDVTLFATRTHWVWWWWWPLTGPGSVTIGPGSEVRAGNGDNVPGSNGSAFVITDGMLRLGAGSLIRGGDGCGAGPAWAFGRDKDINGSVVAGGPYPGCTGAEAVIDPPQGNITGAANVTGCGVDLAAGNLLTIGPLDNAEAIHADEEMVITIAPGGTLNMSALTPETYWLSAGENVTIKADYIELHPEAQLSDIISAPQITWTGQGGRFAQLVISPDGDIVLAPGQSFNFSVFTANAGNMYDQVEWHVTGLEDWWTDGPINRDELLDPMEGMNELIHIEIPEDATPGTTSTLHLSASSSSGEAADSEVNVTVYPAGPQLPCLGDCCNDSGCADPYASNMNCSACIAMGRYWKPYKNSDCFNGETPFDLCLSGCPECCDGIDNLDEDLDIDYPLDGQCTCGLDPNEEDPAWPIPELMSVVMVAIGFVVIVGLVRFRRKD